MQVIECRIEYYNASTNIKWNINLRVGWLSKIYIIYHQSQSSQVITSSQVECLQSQNNMFRITILIKNWLFPCLRYITIAVAISIVCVSSQLYRLDQLTVLFQNAKHTETYYLTELVKMSPLQLVSAFLLLTILTSSCVKGSKIS